MTVKVRPYKRGGWEVDITLTIPGRSKFRERRKAPVGTKSAAKRWGEERERQLIQHFTSTDPSEDGSTDRPDIAKKEVPTLATFATHYIEAHCKANRLRPSTIEIQRKLIDLYLIPVLGRKHLNRLSPEDVQRLKTEYQRLASSSVNSILTMLRSILLRAVEWGVLDKEPVRIKKLKESEPSVEFYDFEELDRLVLAAEQIDPQILLIVLLGAEAGLRCGEIMALEWSDIDLEHGTLTVSRSEWRGHVTETKGGRARVVPLAPRLHEALASTRNLRGPRVLYSKPLGKAYRSPTSTTIRTWLGRAQTAAGFPVKGPHILRKTFCSHLAMKGAAPAVIQRYAGHRTIKTTERYINLSPQILTDSIQMLRRPANWRHAGDGQSKVIRIK